VVHLTAAQKGADGACLFGRLLWRCPILDPAAFTIAADTKQNTTPGKGFCSMYTEHDLGDDIKKCCRGGSLLWSLWAARAVVGSTYLA
jgi:hypothetical protein